MFGNRKHIGIINCKFRLKTLNDMKCSFIFTSHLHQLMDIPEVTQLER